MANWTKKAPNGATNRRQWNLDDRTSLNNLKYHIASEGCSDVQYDLARQLLAETVEHNEASSGEQAVRWLLSAAVQGHEGALELLRECYKLRRGITQENESEVRCCLALTPGERAARKAARELFACLSKGGEHITPRKLERKMREIYKMQKKRRHRHHSTSEEDTEEEQNEEEENLKQTKPMKNGNAYFRPASKTRDELNVEEQRLITEENLVSAAVNYSAGRMPTVNDALTLSVPHPSSLDHVPCFHRLIFHPIIFFTLLYHRLINLASSFPESIPPNVRMLTIFVAYWIFSNDNFTLFLPIGFYYLCFMVMIWSTCKMLKTKHDFIDFRIWSGLFLSYGDNNIQADISENRFLKNNMKPYLWFFGAFVCNLIMHPLIATEWLPHSEITIISCVFVFVTMLTFMYTLAGRQPDWMVLVSFGVNVLAKYPYEMDDVVTTGWRFLDLKVPTFCSFVIGNGIEFCLSCRTALYLLIPGILINIARRNHWQGTYIYLIPHCVTLSWLQLGITASRSATMFGVLRATLGLAGILLFLPLFGLVSLMVPVFVAIEWIGLTDPKIQFGFTVSAAALTLLASCFLAANQWTQKYVTTVQVFICIIAASVLTLPYMTSNFKDSSRFNNINLSPDKRASIITTIPVEEKILNDDTFLSWQNFYSICGPQTWDQQNKIKAQLRCAHLDGLSVFWEGTVQEVKISSVINHRARYIEKYLPVSLASLLECFYGDPVSESSICDSHSGPLCSQILRNLKENGLIKKCSLHKWNTYEYELVVKMPSGLLSKGIDVTLHATNKFSNFSRQIVSGDRIKFIGSLMNNQISQNNHIGEDFTLGTTKTHIRLTAVECVLCLNDNIIPVSVSRPEKYPVNERRRDLMRGIKYFLNVLLNPLITFK